MGKTIFEFIMSTCWILILGWLVSVIVLDIILTIKKLKSKRKQKFDDVADPSKYMQKNIVQEEKKVVTVGGTTRLNRIKGIANLHLAEEELARVIADELIKNELISLNTMCSHEEDCILVRGSIEVIDHRGEAHEA